MPLVGEPGSVAAIATPGAEAGFLAIAGPTFRNEMPARGLLRIAFNRPVRYAARVTCPALLVVAEETTWPRSRPCARSPGCWATGPRC